MIDVLDIVYYHSAAALALFVILLHRYRSHLHDTSDNQV
jgi:hypothetical protein